MYITCTYMFINCKHGCTCLYRVQRRTYRNVQLCPLACASASGQDHQSPDSANPAVRPGLGRQMLRSIDFHVLAAIKSLRTVTAGDP